MSINIIGVTGPSGAGKSLLCTYLAEKLILKRADLVRRTENGGFHILKLLRDISFAV